MYYFFSVYKLDTHKKVLLHTLDDTLVCNNERIIDALTLIVCAWPRTVEKAELIEQLWPNANVTEWALSRLIADIRQLLNHRQSDQRIIKTVHGKGFKLGVEVNLLDDPGFTETSHERHFPSPFFYKQASTLRFHNRKFLIAFIPVIFLFAACAFLIRQFHQDTDWKTRDTLPLAHDYYAPASNWWSNKTPSVFYENNEVVLAPDSDQQLFTFEFDRPAFIQNAQLNLTLSVDDTFVASNSVIKPIAQVVNRSNWPGEWNCPELKIYPRNDDFSLSCSIQSFNEHWLQEKNESSRFGLLIKGNDVKGRIHVKSAHLHFPTAVPLDRNWQASASYQRGVSYRPKAVNDRLIRIFKGPLDLRKYTVVYSLIADDTFIESGTSIQPFLYKVNEHNGMWDCFLENSLLRKSGNTVRCPTLANEPEYVFGTDDYLVIGIQPFGENIAGSVKIVGISILSPDEFDSH